MERSPSKEESEGWTMEDWKRLAEDFVQAFDKVRLPGEEGRYRSPCRLPKSQYIITLHTDSKSGILHLHLDCNRVDMDNCLNSDHRIGIRAKTAPRRSTACAAGHARKTGSRRTKPASRRIASQSFQGHRTALFAGRDRQHLSDRLSSFRRLCRCRHLLRTKLRRWRICPRPELGLRQERR